MTYPLLTLRGFSILGERLAPEMMQPRIARVTPYGMACGPLLAASGELAALLERVCYAHAFRDQASLARTVHAAETLLTRIRPELAQCPILNPSEN
jgi:hypothetical protein